MQNMKYSVISFNKVQHAVCHRIYLISSFILNTNRPTICNPQ